MKLAYFDFRLALTPEVMADIACDNKDCTCHTPLLYGEQAQNHLNDPLYKDCEVELWSGFHDKNGTKIYEGDIVCFKNRGKYNDDRDEVLAKHIKEKCLKKTFLAQIFFKNVGGGYCIEREARRGKKYLGKRYFSLFDMFFYLDFTLEVVGNIHENADLLNNHNKEQE